MDSPFHRWCQQPDNPRRVFNPSPSVRGGIPVYPVDPTYDTRRTLHPAQRQRSGPKVVQIPVHFVGSEPKDLPGYALKIQKVFRGYLVRKSMKMIRDIKAEVDEIEEKLSRSEIVELIQRNDREKLRVNETLMALLLKLDSVRGIDSGVRDCRKTVIRKAIALQERVDAIAAAAAAANSEQNTGDDVESIYRDQEVMDAAETDCSSQLDDAPKELGNCIQIHGDGDCCFGIPEILDGSVKGQDDHAMEMEKDNDDGEIEIVDVEVDREVKVDASNCEGKCLSNNIDEQTANLKENLTVDEERGKIDGDWEKVESEAKAKEENAEDHSRRNCELMEKMIKDNEKMMNMMAQLAERNEMQTRMLNALTNRVDLLEKALVCDRLRKKKKKAARRED